MKNLLILILVVLLGASIVWNFTHNSASSTQDTQNTTQPYSLLARRIQSSNSPDIIINFLSLRSQIDSISKDWGDTFSLYFEYMPSGTKIALNEEKQFDSASLLKLPLVMAYYHQKERQGKNFNNETLTISAKDIDKGFGSLWQQGPGATISAMDAAKLAIIDSDNTAADTLAETVPIADFNAVYEGLGIDLMKNGERYTISTESYSAILKALFFGAVLEKNDSQEILDMMTRTKFSDKIPGPLPKSVKVAHKIGVYGDDLFQDCGIVYAPNNRAYSLCMISKSTEDEARSRMQKISKMIYDYVIEAKNK